MNEERRRFSRIIYPTEAILSRGDQQWTSCVLDISLCGALLDRPDDWTGKQEGAYRLQFQIPESHEQVSMDVHVVHETEDYLGLERESIDVDSISNLKRLIALNLGEEAMLQRELEQMLPGMEEDVTATAQSDLGPDPDEPSQLPL